MKKVFFYGQILLELLILTTKPQYQKEDYEVDLWKISIIERNGGLGEFMA